MKLLEKSQITTAKNRDKANEQAEGMKLARRVDSLREIAAQEEASLKLFREKTIVQIQADIQKESIPLEILRAEVKDLESKRIAALKPLDKEKAEIQKARNEMFKETEVLNAYNEQIRIKEKHVAQALKDAEDEYQRAKEYQTRYKTYLQDANVARINAEDFLKNAVEVKERAIKVSQEMNQELAARDMAMAASERRITMRDESQDEREKLLNARETKLLDREKMFERTLNRQKK